MFACFKERRREIMFRLKRRVAALGINYLYRVIDWERLPWRLRTAREYGLFHAFRDSYRYTVRLSRHVEGARWHQSLEPYFREINPLIVVGNQSAAVIVLNRLVAELNEVPDDQMEERWKALTSDVGRSPISELNATGTFVLVEGT